MAAPTTPPPTITISVESVINTFHQSENGDPARPSRRCCSGGLPAANHIYCLASFRGFLVVFPAQRVASHVLSNSRERILITDDVVIAASLPDRRPRRSS